MIVATKSQPGLFKEKSAMKIFSGFYFAGILAFFLLLAAPAFGQFEVSPDHFDAPPTPDAKKTASVKTSGTRAKSHQQAATAKASTPRKQTGAEMAQVRKPHPGTRVAGSATTTKRVADTNQRHGRASRTAQTGPSLKAQALPAHRE
jgi:hypothetical protein